MDAFGPLNITAQSLAEEAGKVQRKLEAGIDTTALTWGNFLVKNLLPVTLGNIVGGVALGATLWAANRKMG